MAVQLQRQMYLVAGRSCVTEIRVPGRSVHAGAIADAVATLIASQELRHEMGQRGRERAVNEFSQEIIIAQILNLYSKMKKLCFVATIPAVVQSFMGSHIRASSKKWSTKIVTSADSAELLSELGAEFVPLTIKRRVSFWCDVRALVRLVVLFSKGDFDLVHSIMPKAGFMAMFAAWLTRVPNRLHTFTGQVWATRCGLKRHLLKQFDKLTVLFATHILVDSPSQRDFLVAEGVLTAGKGIVIGRGSICGVDVNRFHPDSIVGNEVRAELSIGPEQTVILFLGRLNREKGMLDLAAAFVDIASQNSDVVLVLVGAEEDVSYARIQDICGMYADRLRRVAFTTFPERYMATADIFCLPSYREGFGQVIIEAGACAVPSVASRIYGITDAIEDGETGILFPAGDINALSQSLLQLIKDKNLREKMGNAARARVTEMFSMQEITQEMNALYSKLLNRY